MLSAAYLGVKRIVMAKKAKLEAEHFPHRILWSVVGELREQLDHDPDLIRSVGCAVLLLTHNCFEAYLNSLLSHLARKR